MFPAAFVLLAVPAVAAVAPPDKAADLFRPVGPVPRVRITVDELNLKLLMQDDRKPVRGRFKWNDEPSLRDVALHLKGAAGSRRGWDDKPGLSFNADKFVDGQKFRGMDKFHLNNGVQDASYFQELLGNELALSVGLPACRCTHVMVELNGRGPMLYVLKEGFDKVWLKRHFADPTGNLYDGGFLRDIDQDLKLDSGADDDRKDLKALAKACQIRDKNKRYEAVEKLVDLDRFVTYMAFEIATADWDGYPRNRNNYRVYFDPRAGGRAVFIPHGMDQVLQRTDEGLWHDWTGMVARAIVNHPKGKERVVVRLKEMLKYQFTVERMHKRIDELYPRAKRALEQADKDRVPEFENAVRDLKNRVKGRVEYLTRELADKGEE